MGKIEFELKKFNEITIPVTKSLFVDSNLAKANLETTKKSIDSLNNDGFDSIVSSLKKLSEDAGDSDGISAELGKFSAKLATINASVDKKMSDLTNVINNNIDSIESTLKKTNQNVADIKTDIMNGGVAK